MKSLLAQNVRYPFYRSVFFGTEDKTEGTGFCGALEKLSNFEKNAALPYWIQESTVCQLFKKFKYSGYAWLCSAT